MEPAQRDSHTQLKRWDSFMESRNLDSSDEVADVVFSDAELTSWITNGLDMLTFPPIQGPLQSQHSLQAMKKQNQCIPTFNARKFPLVTWSQLLEPRCG